MLDQTPDKPDLPADEADADAQPAEKAHEKPSDAQRETGESVIPSSGGGMLGRFRAGVAPRPGGPRARPLWRRIAVFLLAWTVMLSAGLAALSALAVFAIGWTGPPGTMNMTLRAMDGVEVRQTWTPLRNVSPHLVRAVIAAEDQRFCQHDGFDMVQIERALAEAERGRQLRGASTISQQTAKNVFLWNGGGWARKGAEAWFTVLLETMWTKPRIMEIYLNVAEWGDGLYGAEAAAQARFGVSARDLNARQAALLAAVLPSPNRWRIDGDYANRRAGQIQILMGMVRRDGLDACVVR